MFNAFGPLLSILTNKQSQTQTLENQDDQRIQRSRHRNGP